MSDLVGRIERLADDDAIGALDLVLRHQSAGHDELAVRAEEAERRFLQALAVPEARHEIEARALIQPAAASGNDLTRKGDLARAALVYLAEHDGVSREDVSHVLDRPSPAGQRDPFTLVIVGVVVLALRPKIDIERDPLRGWKFVFRTEPLKDSAMAKVLGQLLSVIFPRSPEQ
jgi:hypothetical protein